MALPEPIHPWNFDETAANASERTLRVKAQTKQA